MLENINITNIINQVAFVQIYITYIYNSQIDEKFQKLWLLTSFSNITTYMFHRIGTLPGHDSKCMSEAEQVSPLHTDIHVLKYGTRAINVGEI